MAVLLVAGGVVSLAAGSGAKPASGHWVVHDLGARVDVGTGDGGFYVHPGMMALNERGQVIGTRQLGYNAERSEAFLWARGRLTYLPPSPGHNRTAAVAINDRGRVTGVSWKENVSDGSGEETQHAVIWEGGRARDLGAPTGALATTPTAINARGDVVGDSSSDTESFIPSGALLWRNGRMLDLGDEKIEAPAINDRGEIVGSGQPPDSNVIRAYLWRGGRTLYLQTPGSGNSAALDINERGQVAGVLDSGRRAFFWSSGTLRAIQGYSPYDVGPVMLNDRGQVVETDGEGWILWQNGRRRSKGRGEATDLNERGQVTIADSDGVAAIWDKGKTTRLPLLRGDEGAVALAVNERNQIVGLSGRENRTDPHDRYWKCRAVMWTWQSG